MTARDLKRVPKKYYKSYPARDHKTTDGLVSDAFRFTGPLDNRLDRQTDFEHCGAAGRAMAAIETKRLVTEDDHVFVTYEIRKKDGGRVRNTELLTLRDGQIVEVEVYFGWSLPQTARPGGFVPHRKEQVGSE
jgi:hypothetical protein